MLDHGKQIKAWIRSQHLICDGTDFIFETVDQTQLEKFELCIESMGGKVRAIKAVGNWPMGLNRSFKILRASQCSTPRRRRVRYVLGEKRKPSNALLGNQQLILFIKPSHPCWFCKVGVLAPFS